MRGASMRWGERARCSGLGRLRRCQAKPEAIAHACLTLAVVL